jgi:hypothetical protein
MKSLTRFAAALALASTLCGAAQAFPSIAGPGGAIVPGQPVFALSPDNIAPFQTTVAASGGAGANGATLPAAARPGRQVVTVINSGTTAIYLGGGAVTSGTGVQLPGVAGASITIAFTGALYAITASGSQAVTGYELY